MAESFPLCTYTTPTKPYARAGGPNKDEDGRRKGPQRLLRQMQFEVCMMIAYGTSDRSIAEKIFEKYGQTIHWTTINQSYRHGRKWSKVITYLRGRYLNTISRRPCMQKGWRLKGLEDAFIIAIEDRNLKSVAQLHSQILDEVEGRQKIEIKQTNETKVFTGAAKASETKTEEEILADLNRRFKSQFEERK